MKVLIFILGIFLGYLWCFTSFTQFMKESPQRAINFSLKKNEKAFYYEEDNIYVIKRIK